MDAAATASNQEGKTTATTNNNNNKDNAGAANGTAALLEKRKRSSCREASMSSSSANEMASSSSSAKRPNPSPTTAQPKKRKKKKRKSQIPVIDVDAIAVIPGTLCQDEETKRYFQEKMALHKRRHQETASPQKQQAPKPQDMSRHMQPRPPPVLPFKKRHSKVSVGDDDATTSTVTTCTSTETATTAAESSCSTAAVEAIKTSAANSHATVSKNRNTAVELQGLATDRRTMTLSTIGTSSLQQAVDNTLPKPSKPAAGLGGNVGASGTSVQNKQRPPPKPKSLCGSVGRRGYAVPIHWAKPTSLDKNAPMSAEKDVTKKASSLVLQAEEKKETKVSHRTICGEKEPAQAPLVDSKLPDESKEHPSAPPSTGLAVLASAAVGSTKAQVQASPSPDKNATPLVRDDKNKSDKSVGKSSDNPIVVDLTVSPKKQSSRRRKSSLSTLGAIQHFLSKTESKDKKAAASKSLVASPQPPQNTVGSSCSSKAALLASPETSAPRATGISTEKSLKSILETADTSKVLEQNKEAPPCTSMPLMPSLDTNDVYEEDNKLPLAPNATSEHENTPRQKPFKLSLGENDTSETKMKPFVLALQSSKKRNGKKPKPPTGTRPQLVQANDNRDLASAFMPTHQSKENALPEATRATVPRISHAKTKTLVGNAIGDIQHHKSPAPGAQRLVDKARKPTPPPPPNSWGKRWAPPPPTSRNGNRGVQSSKDKLPRSTTPSTRKRWTPPPPPPPLQTTASTRINNLFGTPTTTQHPLSKPPSSAAHQSQSLDRAGAPESLCDSSTTTTCLTTPAAVSILQVPLESSAKKCLGERALRSTTGQGTKSKAKHGALVECVDDGSTECLDNSNWADVAKASVKAQQKTRHNNLMNQRLCELPGNRKSVVERVEIVNLIRRNISDLKSEFIFGSGSSSCFLSPQSFQEEVLVPFQKKSATGINKCGFEARLVADSEDQYKLEMLGTKCDLDVFEKDFMDWMHTKEQKARHDDLLSDPLSYCMDVSLASWNGKAVEIRSHGETVGLWVDFGKNPDFWVSLLGDSNVPSCHGLGIVKVGSKHIYTNAEFDHCRRSNQGDAAMTLLLPRNVNLEMLDYSQVIGGVREASHPDHSSPDELVGDSKDIVACNFSDAVSSSDAVQETATDLQKTSVEQQNKLTIELAPISLSTRSSETISRPEPEATIECQLGPLEETEPEEEDVTTRKWSTPILQLPNRPQIGADMTTVIQTRQQPDDARYDPCSLESDLVDYEESSRPRQKKQRVVSFEFDPKDPLGFSCQTENLDGETICRIVSVSNSLNAIISSGYVVARCQANGTGGMVCMNSCRDLKLQYYAARDRGQSLKIYFLEDSASMSFGVRCKDSWDGNPLKQADSHGTQTSSCASSEAEDALRPFRGKPVKEKMVASREPRQYTDSAVSEPTKKINLKSLLQNHLSGCPKRKGPSSVRFNEEKNTTYHYDQDGPNVGQIGGQSVLAGKMLGAHQDSREDCQDYSKFGQCKYGASCKYNHRPNAQQSGGGMKVRVYPSERHPNSKSKQYKQVGHLGPVANANTEAREDCRDYRNGACKYGASCRYNHPPSVPVHPIGRHLNSESSQCKRVGYFVHEENHISKRQRTQALPVSIPHQRILQTLPPAASIPHQRTLPTPPLKAKVDGQTKEEASGDGTLLKQYLTCVSNPANDFVKQWTVEEEFRLQTRLGNEGKDKETIRRIRLRASKEKLIVIGKRALLVPGKPIVEFSKKKYMGPASEEYSKDDHFKLSLSGISFLQRAAAAISPSNASEQKKLAETVIGEICKPVEKAKASPELVRFLLREIDDKDWTAAAKLRETFFNLFATNDKFVLAVDDASSKSFVVWGSMQARKVEVCPRGDIMLPTIFLRLTNAGREFLLRGRQTTAATMTNEEAITRRNPDNSLGLLGTIEPFWFVTGGSRKNCDRFNSGVCKRGISCQYIHVQKRLGNIVDSPELKFQNLTNVLYQECPAKFGYKWFTAAYYSAEKNTYYLPEGGALCHWNEKKDIYFYPTKASALEAVSRVLTASELHPNQLRAIANGPAKVKEPGPAPAPGHYGPSAINGPGTALGHYAPAAVKGPGPAPGHYGPAP